MLFSCNKQQTKQKQKCSRPTGEMPTPNKQNKTNSTKTNNKMAISVLHLSSEANLTQNTTPQLESEREGDICSSSKQKA